jgi:hypothetical protein
VFDRAGERVAAWHAGLSQPWRWLVTAAFVTVAAAIVGYAILDALRSISQVL